ncbi:hexitol phosphatase HxpB [Glaesserella sp.]|uniref:hexitol phosphatase HxpB n=1 Tax=Glaesserella sp. TaxID=2094731 RepID=UPI00359F94A5
MKKAFIFDMDGLLINSEPYWRQAGVEVLNRHGVPVTLADMFRLTGMPSSAVVASACEYYQCNHINQTQVVGELLERAIGLILEQKPLMTGVKETLELLSTNQIKMAIASASPRKMLEDIVESCNIAHYFSYISSAAELEYNKPHPQVYLHAMQKLGLSPNECVGLEDSKVGMVAVKAASMACIVVPSREQWREPCWDLADAKLNSLLNIDEGLLKRI